MKEKELFEKLYKELWHYLSCGQLSEAKQVLFIITELKTNRKD